MMGRDLTNTTRKTRQREPAPPPLLVRMHPRVKVGMQLCDWECLRARLGCC
jgi:hypothetical protein